MLDIVVGITSWPKRIFERFTKEIVFRLVAQQNTSINYKVCLVLSTEEFPNKENDIPKWCNELNALCDRFEILWVEKNTRAWKKLDPVMSKYPDLPIITTDDNKLLTRDAIQKLYDEYKKDPVILSCKNAWGFINNTKEFITGTPRLYPPNSLYDLDVNYFMNDFLGLQADVFNAIRAILKNTKAKKLNYNLIEKYYSESDKTGLRKEYKKTDWKKLQKEFLDKHTELKSIWDKNV